MICKKKIVENIILKWKAFLRVLLQNKRDSSALKVISALATFLYEWNQNYRDKELETYLEIIANRNLYPTFNHDESDNQTILFYDSFGFDNRGLTIIYLKSLCELGYKVVYISPLGKKQPILENATKNYNVIWKYVPYKNSLRKAHSIIQIFNEWKPRSAFLYALPGDSAAIASFNVLNNRVIRFQINLTDHAFWLGTNAFDYCVEFRDFGATISHMYRSIDKSKIIILPYYPYIDKSIPFEGFSNKFDGKQIIFSGGSLKKTLGDEGLLYYEMVKRILLENDNTAFLYAGSGQDTFEMDKLISQFRTRAERISERKDLYQVLKHSTIFLNTYPDNGGLMTQYSAVAGKLPITLYDGDRDLSGLITNRDKLNVEFKDINLLLAEVKRILSDDAYRQKKESYLYDSVISESVFKTELERLIEYQKTKFNFSFDLSINLQNVSDEYVRNFNVQEQLLFAVSYYKINAIIFPRAFIKLFVRKLFKNIK